MNRLRGPASFALGFAACAALIGCQGGAPQSDAGASGEPPVQLTTVEQSTLREEAIGVLEELMSSRWAQDRGNSIEAMEAAGQRAEPWVALGLKDSNEGVRAVAAMVAGRAKLCGLSGAMRAQLNDPSAFARLSALFGLAACGENVDLSPLSSALLSDPSPRVRAHAAYILGELGNPSAIPMLRQAAAARFPLGSDSELRVMQLQISEAMVKLGDVDAIQSVRAALHPSRPDELEAAALAIQIIGEVRDQRSADQLVYLSAFVDESGNPLPAEIRLAIASAMGKLGRTDGKFIADEYASSERPSIRAQAARVYGDLGDPAGLAPLRSLLDDEDPGVRLAAASGVLDVLSANRAAGAGEN